MLPGKQEPLNLCYTPQTLKQLCSTLIPERMTSASLNICMSAEARSEPETLSDPAVELKETLNFENVLGGSGGLSKQVNNPYNPFSNPSYPHY